MLRLAETGEFVAPCDDYCAGVIRYEGMHGQCPLFRQQGCWILKDEDATRKRMMVARGWPRKYVEEARWDECRAKTLLKKWLLDRDSSEGLLLHGPVGTGKTMAAALVALEWERQNIRTSFVYFSELAGKLSESGGAKMGLVVSLTEPQVLVVDDFGVGNVAPWSIGLLDLLFESRNAEGKVTIVTTNLTPRTLKEEPTWTRIVDRWRESLYAVTVPGESMRAL